MNYYLRGQLAEKANINMETLRYYEKIELITKPKRNESGYRIYPEETLVQLNFINMAKNCGFTLGDIRQVFEYISHPIDCTEKSNSVIESKLEEIDKQISNLQRMKNRLEEIKENVSDGDCSFYLEWNKEMKV